MVTKKPQKIELNIVIKGWPKVLVFFFLIIFMVQIIALIIYNLIVG